MSDTASRAERPAACSNIIQLGNALAYPPNDVVLSPGKTVDMMVSGRCGVQNAEAVAFLFVVLNDGWQCCDCSFFAKCIMHEQTNIIAFVAGCHLNDGGCGYKAAAGVFG